MKRTLAILAIAFLLLGVTVSGYCESNALNPASVRYQPIKSQYGTGQLITGPCWVKSVSITAPTAGDAAMIYNGTSGDPKGIEFELIISVNSSMAHKDCGGAYFEKGLYVHATDSDVLITVVYDY